MTAIALNQAERFSALDGLEIVYIPVIASLTLVPTRAEIDAGTDVSTEVAEWAGFSLASGKIPTPGLKRFTGSISGELTAEDSSLSIYADRTGDDVRDVLPRDTVGFIALMPSGDTPTERMSVWPVQVNALTEVYSREAATLLRADLNITREPNENVTIPAAAG